MYVEVDVENFEGVYTDVYVDVNVRHVQTEIMAAIGTETKRNVFFSHPGDEHPR